MLETDRSAESRLHLAGDVKVVEDRLCAGVVLNDLRAFGSDEFQIMMHILKDGSVINLDGREIGAEYIPDDTERSSHFFAHEADRLDFLECLNRLLPTVEQQS